MENAEKVVNPPKSPIVKKEKTVSGIRELPERIKPAQKLPNRLTNRVESQGVVEIWEIQAPAKNLSKVPKKPPRPIKTAD